MMAGFGQPHFLAIPMLANPILANPMLANPFWANPFSNPMLAKVGLRSGVGPRRVGGP